MRHTHTVSTIFCALLLSCSPSRTDPERPRGQPRRRRHDPARHALRRHDALHRRPSLRRQRLHPGQRHLHRRGQGRPVPERLVLRLSAQHQGAGLRLRALGQQAQGRRRRHVPGRGLRPRRVQGPDPQVPVARRRHDPGLRQRHLDADRHRPRQGRPAGSRLRRRLPGPGAPHRHVRQGLRRAVRSGHEHQRLYTNSRR